MNIQQFYYILAVAEHLHFEKAAEYCYISQSTLSTMISRFEDEIGIKIFDRRTKPVTVTREGMLVIKQLKQITYEIEQLDELTKEIKGEVNGIIKIGCIHTIAPFLLPYFLQDFATKYPDLQIQIKENSTNSIIHQLKSRDLDIGIVSPPLYAPELKEYPLYNEEFVYYDLTKPATGKIIPDDLNTENFWLMEESHCMRSQVVNICDLGNNNQFSGKNIHFKAGSIDSLIRFTHASQGKTLLPLLSLTDFNPDDRKFIHFFRDPAPFRHIELVTHEHFVKHKILKLISQEIQLKITPELLRIKASFVS